MDCPARASLPRILLLLLLAGSPLRAGTPAVAERREPVSSRGRLEAIAPLVAGAVRGEGLGAGLAQRAGEVGVAAARLKLWLDLFLAHGREGLVDLSPASAVELARLQEGTWRMTFRMTRGEPLAPDAWLFNEIVELREGYARLRSLTLQASSPDSAGAGQAMKRRSLGAYGEIVQKDVGGGEYGLAPGETAVLQTFEFELRGENSPGTETPLTARTQALFVKQGELYRSASFDVAFFVPDRSTRLMSGSYEATAITAQLDSETATYFGVDSQETKERISDDLLLRESLGAIWKKASADPALLDPNLHRIDPWHFAPAPRVGATGR